MLTMPISWRTLGLSACLGLLLALTSSAAADTRVWVNTNSGVYHCPGTQYYGNTKHGEYLREREAVADGYRAAYGQPCSTQDVQQARSSLRQQLNAGPTGGATMVWVNTSSHVYHCPGTRYYGVTKHGRYMPESDAIASGNRPAYGMRC
jgi:hypothetical protein